MRVFESEVSAPKRLVYEEWNFVCPGPSAVTLDEDEFLDGPVVAVNAAIALYETADVWGMTRVPKAMDDILVDYGTSTAMALKVDGLVLWVRRGQLKLWNDVNDPLVARVKGTYPNRTPAFEQVTGIKTRVEWSKVSWLGLVGVAIGYGAKRVRVVGADMAGTGYGGLPAGGPYGWKEFEDEEWRKRWMLERRIVSMAVADAKLAGLEIEVVEVARKTQVAVQAGGTPA